MTLVIYFWREDTKTWLLGHVYSQKDRQQSKNPKPHLFPVRFLSKNFHNQWSFFQKPGSSIIINMLTQYIIEQQAQNRRAQRSPIPLENVLTRINIEDYENLIQWVFENSEVMGLNCSTKYLARTFFDASIIDAQIIPYNQYIALALAALALAIKFNESRQLSERLTLQTLLSSVDIKLSRAEYLSLESKVMRSLSFVFRYTSPNDYLDLFMERFPFFPKFRKVIPKFIELALMRPRACQYTAEEIFFGAVLALIELHKPTFNDFQAHLLFSLTDTWEKAKIAAMMIAESIAIAEQDQ